MAKGRRAETMMRGLLIIDRRRCGREAEGGAQGYPDPRVGEAGEAEGTDQGGVAQRRAPATEKARPHMQLRAGLVWLLV